MWLPQDQYNTKIIPRYVTLLITKYIPDVFPSTLGIFSGWIF